MTVQEIARKLASQSGVKADKSDLYLREYDNMVELVGLVPDPNYNMKDFVGREMLFPKRWVTLDVFDAEMAV